MKRRIISFVLVCVMVLSSLLMTSCNSETVIEEVAAKIYTVYTICEEGTTKEAIKSVELALNRLINNELDLCIQLVMVPEDEYEDLISAKYAEIEAYNAEKTAKAKEKKNKTTSSADESSASSEEASVDVMTADEYIDLLEANLEAMENGEEYTDYVLDEPRLDIFLVRGYDNYISLVSEDKLAALDDKLSAEAKVIKDYIYPTFLDAAKVTNAKGTRKTYGIPMNKGIGEYSYIVFDKEYLDKYQIDAGTMTNLEDLEYYLEIIAENETDVVPLANVFDSPEFAYLFEDGFSAYIEDGEVVDTYKNASSLDYFTMISRYHSLGYIKDDPGDTGWAVKFVRGTYADLEALEKQTGREYSYSIHSYPVASNEDLLSNLFCISSYAVSNELTDVSEILAYMETNEEITNILAYGIEGEHYELTDNDQIKVTSNDYGMDINYVGNLFLTKTLDGENTEKWELLKQQNLDSSLTADRAVTVGFAYYPVSIEDPNDSDITYSEPDYVEIIQSFCEEFYPDILKGVFATVSYQELKDYVSPQIRNAQLEEITARYTKIVDDQIEEEIQADYLVGTAKYNEILKKAQESAFNKYNTRTNRNKLIAAVKKQVAADPEYNTSEESITARVNEICTEEYLSEQISITYAKSIADRTTTLLQNTIESAISEKSKTVFASDEYKERVNASLNSEECLAEIAAVNSIDVFAEYPDVCLEKCNEYLKSLIQEKLTAKFEELNVELRKAYKKFADEYIARYDFDDVETRSDPDYRTAIVYTVSNTKKISSALKSELRNIVTQELGEDALAEDIKDTTEDRFTDKWIASVVDETFTLNANPDATIDNMVSTEALREIVNKYITIKDVKASYENVLLASFEDAIGLIKTVNIDLGEEEEEEESTEEGEETEEAEEEDDGIVKLEDADLYSIIFEKRIQKQYYKYNPLPEV